MAPRRRSTTSKLRRQARKQLRDIKSLSAINREIVKEQNRARRANIRIASLQKKAARIEARRQSQKAARHQLSQLHKLGLYTPKKRTTKPTKYGKSLLQRLSDVLTGRTVVRKAPKSVRQKYAGTFRQRKGKLLIPRVSPKEKITITKKGEVKRTREEIIGGPSGPFRVRFQSFIIPNKQDDLSNLPEGPRIYYGIRVRQLRSGGYGYSGFRTQLKSEMINFMQSYDVRLFQHELFEIFVDDVENLGPIRSAA